MKFPREFTFRVHLHAGSIITREAFTRPPPVDGCVIRLFNLKGETIKIRVTAAGGCHRAAILKLERLRRGRFSARRTIDGTSAWISTEPRSIGQQLRHLTIIGSITARETRWNGERSARPARGTFRLFTSFGLECHAHATSSFYLGEFFKKTSCPAIYGDAEGEFRGSHHEDSRSRKNWSPA